MAPIFETIMNKNSSSNPSSQSSSSSSFIVRNHAIGNNPCFPYDACITTHLGDDVDILLWEQSMNCGREVLPLQVFTTIAAYHMKKQPTVIYLLSGGPTWTKSFCEQLYANSSSSSEGRDDGSSSRSSGSGSNSLRDSRRINQLRNLSDLEINLLQNDIRTNANLSHHGFLHQFRFLHDDTDDSYLAERFSNSAPMAQVSYEVMIKMMLLMIIMMVMVVAMMMMMMMMMMMLMVSVNKFLMLAFFTSL